MHYFLLLITLSVAGIETTHFLAETQNKAECEEVRDAMQPSEISGKLICQPQPPSKL